MELFLPDKEFFSIKEVSHITKLEPYVLRFWETEFKILSPQRRQSGHRKYTKKDIEIISQIKDLLHEKKYTIEGAKKFLSNQRRHKIKQLEFPLEESAAAISLLKEIKKELLELQKILE